MNSKLNEGRADRTFEVALGLHTITAAPPIVCNDGFTVSIQCSKYAYCEPRENLHPSEYTSFELGYPSALDSLLEEYAEEDSTTETIFPYVPRNVVEALLEKHGGIKTV